jgi:REP element-mobilizing transposase RayT
LPDTTRNNNDPCDSVTSFNKTYSVGKEKSDDENIKNKSISKKRLHDKGQPQGIAPTVNDIRGVKTKKWLPFDGKLWQRNYYEHIIRDEQSYLAISEYIANNPVYLEKDRLYGE